MIPTGIHLAITSGYVATILGVSHPFPRKPLVCPGTIDPAYYGEFSIIIGNLTNDPFLINLKYSIAYFKLLPANKIDLYAAYGDIYNLGHPSPKILTTLPTIGKGSPKMSMVRPYLY